MTQAGGLGQPLFLPQQVLQTTQCEMAGDFGSDLKSAQGVGLQHFLPSTLGSAPP